MTFLLRREINLTPQVDRAIKSEMYFQGFVHHGEINIFDDPNVEDFLDGKCSGVPSDIIAHGNVVAVLTDVGLCVVYSKTAREAFVLNESDDERVCAFFHNRKCNSLILVTRTGTSWSICSYPFSHLELGYLYQGVNLFEQIPPPIWPTSVQFDELNGLLITHHKLRKHTACVVYDLADYRPLYCLPTTNSHSVQISKDLLVITEIKAEQVVQFSVYGIHTGELLRKLHYILPADTLEFSVAFNAVILIKPKRGKVSMLDIVSGKYRELDREASRSRSFLIPLRHQFFVSRVDNLAWVWDTRGELLTTFDDQGLHSSLFTVEDLNLCAGFRFLSDGMEVVDVVNGTTIARISGHDVHPVDAMTFDGVGTIVTASTCGIQMWQRG